MILLIRSELRVFVGLDSVSKSASVNPSEKLKASILESKKGVRCTAVAGGQEPQINHD
jgi:hypothetical protein